MATEGLFGRFLPPWDDLHLRGGRSSTLNLSRVAGVAADLGGPIVTFLTRRARKRARPAR
jgi:hypothetical protein